MWKFQFIYQLQGGEELKVAIVLFQGRLVGYNRDAAKNPHTRSIANRCYQLGEQDYGDDDLLDFEIADEEGEHVYCMVQRLFYTPKQEKSSQLICYSTEFCCYFVSANVTFFESTPFPLHLVSVYHLISSPIMKERFPSRLLHFQYLYLLLLPQDHWLPILLILPYMFIDDLEIGVLCHIASMLHLLHLRFMLHLPLSH